MERVKRGSRWKNKGCELKDTNIFFSFFQSIFSFIIRSLTNLILPYFYF